MQIETVQTTLQNCEIIKKHSPCYLPAIFTLNDPEDQLGILNDVIIKHLEEHAPMKRIRVTW